MSTVDRGTFIQVWEVYAQRYDIRDVMEDNRLPLGKRQRYSYLSQSWLRKRPYLMDLLDGYPRLRRAVEVRFQRIGADTMRICAQNRHPNWFWAERQPQLTPTGTGILFDSRPWCPTCGEVSDGEVL